jgi:hypothetical protein
MDVVVDPGWLRPLTDFLDANPGSGAACPLIVLESDLAGSTPPGRTSTSPDSASTGGSGSPATSPGTIPSG